MARASAGGCEMMRKKLIMLCLSLCCLGPCAAQAENPAAQDLKNIFRSGQFYVEYKDDYNVRVMGEKNGARMERTSYGTSLSWVASLNPLGNLFGGRAPKNPEVMYRAGTYYQFVEPDKAFVCSADELAEENLDPRMGWNKVRSKLALPLELAPLYWQDPYAPYAKSLTEPQFLASSKVALGGKTYEADRYSSTIRTSDGGEAKYIYELLYLDGHLAQARSFVQSGNQERAVNTLEIKAVGGTWPQELFRLEKKTKLYAAGRGDMNDLLEEPVQIGMLEGI